MLVHIRMVVCRSMSNAIRWLSLDGKEQWKWDWGRIGWCCMAWAALLGSGFIARHRKLGTTLCLWGFPSQLGSLCLATGLPLPLHAIKFPINIFSFRKNYWHTWLTRIFPGLVLHAWNVLSSPLRSLLPHWPLYSAKRHFNLPHCCAAKWFLIWLVLLNGLSMLTGSIKSLGVSLKLF